MAASLPLGFFTERSKVLLSMVATLTDQEFGESAKVIDFVDGRGMRIRHVARFCEVLGIESAHFAGNSMGAINLLVDTTQHLTGLSINNQSFLQ